MRAAEPSTSKESPEDALAELERFVVENDDLLALEERIGRFNIFDALGIARVEIRHSNFLAWLLDPQESHGQGDLFLKALLMDLLRNAPAEKRPFTAIELDGADLHGVEIRREWRNIDLLVLSRDPSFVVIVENKIDSGEHSGQLRRYRELVSQSFHGARALYVFLTEDSADPSEDDWVTYSYTDIHRVLSRVRRSQAGAIGMDVSVFLDQYLELLGSRFMDNPQLAELCRRIYKNHRRAIDLIVQHAASPSVERVAAVADLIRSDPGKWVQGMLMDDRCVFSPREWHTRFSGDQGERASACGWLTWQVVVRPTKCEFRVTAWPSSDPERRIRIIERLIADPSEFGLRAHFRTWRTQRNTRLITEEIDSWPEDDMPSPDVLAERVKKHIESRLAKFRDLPQAVEEHMR